MQSGFWTTRNNVNNNESDRNNEKGCSWLTTNDRRLMISTAQPCKSKDNNNCVGVQSSSFIALLTTSVRHLAPTVCGTKVRDEGCRTRRWGDYGSCGSSRSGELCMQHTNSIITARASRNTEKQRPHDRPHDNPTLRGITLYKVTLSRVCLQVAKKGQ